MEMGVFYQLSDNYIYIHAVLKSTCTYRYSVSQLGPVCTARSVATVFPAAPVEREEALQPCTVDGGDDKQRISVNIHSFC